MIVWIMTTVFTVFTAAAALYFIAPGAVFNVAMVIARRTAGLHLKETTVDGHRVPYLEGGHGEPLVLLHGFGANKDHWTMIAPFLTRHFHVIAPDVPGFGDSSRKHEARYGLDEQIERLADFTASLGLEHFHLGGNSMGGYLAAIFAARHPEKTKSLWLLAPAGAMSAEQSELQNQIEQGKNLLVIEDEQAFDELTDMVFTVKPPMPAQFKRPLMKRAFAEAPFNTKMFEDLFADPVGLETALKDCDTRALVVWGDNDRLLHPSGAEVLRDVMNDVECRIMPNMGHVPMLERPAETAADYLRFQGKAA